MKLFYSDVYLSVGPMKNLEFDLCGKKKSGCVLVFFPNILSPMEKFVSVFYCSFFFLSASWCWLRYR